MINFVPGTFAQCTCRLNLTVHKVYRSTTLSILCASPATLVFYHRDHSQQQKTARYSQYVGLTILSIYLVSTISSYKIFILSAIDRIACILAQLWIHKISWLALLVSAVVPCFAACCAAVRQCCDVPGIHLGAKSCAHIVICCVHM